jgi:hypothetical protein
MKATRTLGLSLCWVLIETCRPGIAAPPEQPPSFTEEQVKFFRGEVYPILQSKCHKCHGAEHGKGHLSLTSRESVLKGGDSGPAVDPEALEESPLLLAVNYQDGLEMPPTGKLPPEQVEILSRWVKMGAPWTPEGAPPVVDPTYLPLERPEPPAVANSAWVRNPIDAFILAKLEAKGLAPNPPADRLALVRRVYADLIGLPPTPDEADAFVNDQAPDAYERLVEKLMASPHYGEKWGRHWLDVVRYAETNGYERDGPKPFAWRYRDYVIRSFNDDKPFDQFIREQIAGDEIAPTIADGEAAAEAIIGSGYHRLGLWDDEPADPEQARFDEFDDLVATTGQAFLGMTLNCARCHDHKIDPIPQADYYKMVAFFRDIPPYSNTRDVSSKFNLTDITPAARRSAYEADLKKRESRIDALAASMVAIEDEGIRKMPAEDQRASEGLDRPRVVEKLKAFLEAARWEEYARLKGECDQLKAVPLPKREMALSVNNRLADPPVTHILMRGNAHAEGAEVRPGYPSIFNEPEPAIPGPGPDAKGPGRRTILADWLASPKNPRTARVFANRLWQHHFGRGIVASSNDFGRFGTPATHPELLDWLADEFLNGGWAIKRMHKLIMTSSTYRMSSSPNAASAEADPANNLFWRFPMRRLGAEEVRDAMLSVSGALNPAIGGPSVYPPIPKAVLAGQSVPGQGWGKSTPEEAARRSVYVHVKRSLLLPILSQHDQADTDSSCPVRYTTTVPTQALGLLNGEFANEQAAKLAERLRAEAPGDLAGQVRRAIRLTTGRIPAEPEVQQDLEFIAKLRAKGNLDEARALRQYALMILNTNEFVYLD